MIVIVAAAAIYGVFVVSERDSEDGESGIINVTTSFYPLYYLASEIGGDKARVSVVTPPGAEPHEYEPTARDIARIEGSDLFVANGAHFEAWADGVVSNLDPDRTHVIFAGEPHADGLFVHDDEEETDPHVWLAPSLAAKMATLILESYAAIDPENENTYRANALGLSLRLAALDASYKRALATCEKRDIVTTHSAFGYLSSAYNLRQVAIAGLSTKEEPSARDLANISLFARENDVRYIFFESLVSSKLADTIATEVGAQTLVLNPLEGLTDEEVASGADYFSVMNQNLSNLVKALSCTI